MKSVVPAGHALIDHAGEHGGDIQRARYVQQQRRKRRRNEGLIRFDGSQQQSHTHVPFQPPPRPDICTSSQYQSYLNNWASRVATNVSICVGPPIGRGSGAGASGGAGGRHGGSGGGRNGRDLPGCRRMANPDHFQTVSSRKTVAKRQAVAEQQIPTILGSPTEGNPTEERAAGGDPCRCDELFA